MKIAVIDDGINPSFYDIGDLVLDLEVTPELKMINRKEVDEVNSHGTICAAIIKKYCYNTQFISIKILDSSYGISTPEQLIVAVNWCVKNKIKIVNLSLGTIDYRDFDSIKKCINEAAQNGLIIIAAGNNEGNISYPAFLSNVVGVRHKSKIYNSKKYILREFPADGIECETPGIHTLISNNGISKATFPANSYAAPYITAIISEYIQNKKDDNIDILDVKNFLKKKESGAYVKKIYQKNRKIDWVQNALIICFDKELGSILHRSNLSFNFKLLFVKTERNAFEYLNSFFRLVDDMKEYDTVIVLDNKKTKVTSKEQKKVIERIVQLQIGFIYINDRKQIKYKRIISNYLNKTRIQYAVLPFNIKKNIIRKLPVPVIKIIDTKGKNHNEIALRLREKFCSENYFAISMSYSVEGMVFGSESVFQNNGLLNINYEKKLYNLYKPDLVIIHYSMSDIRYRRFSSRIKADICIYIVEDNESFEFIRKENNEKIIINHGFCTHREWFNDESNFNKLYNMIINILK